MKKEQRINELMLFNLYSDLKSISKVAKHFGICRKRVRKILLDNKKPIFSNLGGAPKKLQNYEEKKLVKQFKNKTFKLASEGVDYIKENFDKKVSKTLVRSTLKENDLVSKKVIKVPCLSPANVNQRRVFYNMYKNYITSDFKNFIFSDESRYKLSGSDSNNTYYGSQKESFFDREKVGVKKYGGGSVHVWGCITYHGVGKLIHLRENVKTDPYIHTLIEGLFGTLDEYGLRADEVVFQQDNAKPHTSSKVKKFFADQRIEVSYWPSNSPDMNIIENVWEEVNRRVRKIRNNFQNEEELWKAVEEAWYSIDNGYIKRLYFSIVSRLKSLKANKFRNTKY